MSLLGDPTKRRWLAWGALGVVFLLVNIHRLSTAVLSEQLTADFGITAAQLGTLHASFFIIYALTQVPTGVLADRYGPRYVGSGGAFVLSVGALGFVASNGYVAAFLSRALIGLGSSVIFVTILRFCANWYRTDEFGTMIGLTAGIAGLGAIFATTPLAVAIDRVGWRPTLTALGVLGFVGGALVFLLARKSPANAGLEPIDDVPEQPSVTLRETGAYLTELAGDLDQWLLSIVFFATNGTVLTVIGLWGVPYLVVVYDVSVTTASTYTLLGSVGILVGGPAVGWVSDRLGRRILPMIAGLSAFLAALLVVPVVGKPPLALVAAAYFVIGFAVGFAMLALSAVKEKYPPDASGVATATVNAWGFVGATVLPTLMGIALDEYRTDDTVAGSVVYTEFGYRVAFAITAVAVVVAICSATTLYVRERRAGVTLP
ncbi:MFS transporter [Halobacteriales archaeon QH_6_66_25]|nr:MAG: MFS transporter [Halobacteriales archaeon QH_6_66_25]